MSTLKIIVASTRPGRVGLSVAHWFLDVARRHGGFDEYELLDLADFALPLFDEPHHPRLRQYTKPHTFAWSEAVDSADAFVIVTPEYNYSFPASIKNALDYLVAEWAYKPVGLVSYGGMSGGLRSANMLRGVLAVLRMIPVVEGVALAMVGARIRDGVFAATEIEEASAVTMLDEVGRLSPALASLRVPAGN